MSFQPHVQAVRTAAQVKQGLYSLHAALRIVMSVPACASIHAYAPSAQVVPAVHLVVAGCPHKPCSVRGCHEEAFALTHPQPCSTLMARA